MAAQIHDSQQQHAGNGEGDLVVLPLRGQKAEDGVCAAGNRKRDGEHIVDEQGAARNHAGRGRQQLACHEITAAPRGEQLDYLGVALADDEDGDDRCKADKNGQIVMALQGQECLFRAIAGGGKTVGPQTNPGKKSDEGKLVKHMRIIGIAGSTNNKL
jgi:hypothetical protein